MIFIESSAENNVVDVRVFFQPLPGFMILSGWAVTVSTRAEHGYRAIAFCATKDVDSTGFGATSDNGLDYLVMICRHNIAVFCQIFRAEFTKDLSDGSHIRLLS